MILQSLIQLYDRLEADPEFEVATKGFSKQNIAFCIVLNLDGTLNTIVDLRKDKKMKKMIVPGIEERTSKMDAPFFLRDTPEYLLGIPKPKPDEKSKTKIKFNASKNYHRKQEGKINTPEFSAVCRFFETWDTTLLPHDHFLRALSGGFGVFKITNQNRYLHEIESIRTYISQQANSSCTLGHSLLSGKVLPIARLQTGIKGFGKSAKIASFNAPAYCSYGKEQAFNAPISTLEAFKYTTALNELCDDDLKATNSICITDSKKNQPILRIVFWTEIKSEFEKICIPLFNTNITSDAKTERRLHEIFDEAQHVHLSSSVELLQDDLCESNTKFYVLGIASSQARAVIRFFYQNTVGKIIENLRAHFERLTLVDRPKDVPDYIGIRLLLNQLCPTENGKPKEEEIPANLPDLFIRSILENTLYPDGIYYRILTRYRRDQSRLGDYAKTALIKAILIKNHQLNQEECPMSLNVNNSNSGYLCGRLFACLCKTQKDALGETNSSMRTGYMSAASASPQSVFPRLLRLHQYHLNKLNEGGKIVRDRIVQEILSKLEGGFPAVLKDTDQGLFFIGFYQQTQALFTKKDADSPVATTDDDLLINDNN